MRTWRAVTLLLGAVLLTGLAPVESGSALEGVLYCPSTGHWYMVCRRGPFGFPWVLAQRRAEALGGYLATIGSEVENRWLANHGFDAGTKDTAFLGGTDRVVDGDWRWVTGEPWSYTNWAPGRPASATSGGDYLRMRADGTWEDAPGRRGTTSCYIVEWDENPNAGPAPPATLLPDLSVVVAHTSSHATPGDAIRVDLVIRNEGCRSGTFTAALVLEGHDGPPVDQRTFAGLGPGEWLTATLSGDLPEDLLPGLYRAAAVLSLYARRDADPSDNTGRAPQPFRVDREVRLLTPGSRIEGHLGPHGRQVFHLDAFPALSVRIMAKLVKGSGVLRLEDADGSVLAGPERGRKLRCFISGHEGRLRLLIENGTERPGRYRVRLRVRTIRRRGVLEVGDVPVILDVPGLAGMSASLVLKGRGSFVPRLDLGALDDPERVRTRGGRVKAKGLKLRGEGPWTIGVGGLGDARGRCAYRLRVK